MSIRGLPKKPSAAAARMGGEINAALQGNEINAAKAGNDRAGRCFAPFEMVNETWNRIGLAWLIIVGLFGVGIYNDRVAAILATGRPTGNALGWRFRPANEFSGVKQE